MSDQAGPARAVPFTVTELDGELHIAQQSRVAEGTYAMHWKAWPALRHHYAAGGRNEPIALYRGPLILTQEGEPDRPCHGTVSLTWLPQPRIVLDGVWDQHAT